MVRHGRVETGDQDASRRHWNEDVKIAEEYKEYQYRLIRRIQDHARWPLNTNQRREAPHRVGTFQPISNPFEAVLRKTQGRGLKNG